MGKSLNPITNWPQYNRSLINRGFLTFWVDAAAMNHWFHHEHHGKRGRNRLYTDQTIFTFLMLKGIFSRHPRVARFAVRVDERTALCPRLQLCQQAVPRSEGGLSAALKGAHHRRGYQFNGS